MLYENQLPENRVPGGARIYRGRSANFSGRHSVPLASTMHSRGVLAGLPIKIIVTPSRRASMLQLQVHEQAPGKQRSNSI